ncbi:MAG: hypothetical protein P4L91_03365 [Burkholderiaceae bacterium]|nr:hypothetical protein [Burkholderiaceae bacterium]
MSPEKEVEFNELSAFVQYYLTAFMKIDRNAEIHPSNVLLEIVEKYGRSKALDGLRQATNDIVEQSQDFSLERTSDVDCELISHGIVSLSTIRMRYWSKYKKIIARNAIKSETEYHLVAGILNDLSIALDAGEREELAEMANVYEGKCG